MATINMIHVVLIRHGKTEGNILRQYVGQEDQPLSKAWLKEYKKTFSYAYPCVEMVFISPMKRCRETANFIYPTKKAFAIENLVECDFGDFSGKTYEELKDNITFKNIINNNGLFTFPNGENSFNFRNRCINAFLEIIDECLKLDLKEIAIVCHGGTIMAIMEKLSYEVKDFYFWQARNMGGYDFYFDVELKKAVRIEKILGEEL